MEFLTGLFTEPYLMGALIALLVVIYWITGGDLVPNPNRKDKWEK